MNFKSINELKNDKSLSLNKFFQTANKEDYEKTQEKINLKIK